MFMVGVIGCVQTEEVSFEVDADVEFTHEESVELLMEDFTMTETDVPDGLQITQGVFGELLFEGTLSEGEYPFQLDFEHYGDMSMTKKSRWMVTILAE